MEGHIRVFLSFCSQILQIVTQPRIHWNSLTVEQKGDANKLLLLNYIYGYKGHPKPDVRCHIEYGISLYSVIFCHVVRYVIIKCVIACHVVSISYYCMS